MSNTWFSKQTLEHNEKLIMHSNYCDGIECSYPHCNHGIEFMDHFNQCQFTSENCKKCELVFQVLMYHSKKCGVKNCKFPYCNFINKKLNKKFQNDFNEIKKRIKDENEINQYTLNSVDQSIDTIKKNVQQIIDAYYPNGKIEVI